MGGMTLRIAGCPNSGKIAPRPTSWSGPLGCLVIGRDDAGVRRLHNLQRRVEAAC